VRHSAKPTFFANLFTAATIVKFTPAAPLVVAWLAVILPAHAKRDDRLGGPADVARLSRL
jgi:hypothetical protein